MKVQGRNLKVMAGGSYVACARSCELDVDVELTEVADATSGAWKNFRAGKKGWSVSVSGLIGLNLISASGFNVLVNKVGQTFSLSFEDVSSNVSMSGSAIVKSVKVTGTIGNLAQYSCVFQGNGALG